MASARQARGAYGERRAAQWYLHAGFEVVARNWRDGRAGELDLIVVRPGLTVFVEVKARATDAFGVAEAVTPVKQARIRRLAAAWLAANGPRRGAIRFDVVCVTGTRVEVLEAAF